MQLVDKDSNHDVMLTRGANDEVYASLTDDERDQGYSEFHSDRIDGELDYFLGK